MIGDAYGEPLWESIKWRMLVVSVLTMGERKGGRRLWFNI